MGTVYVVNRAIRENNISDLNRYGDVKFVNYKYVYPDEITNDGKLPGEHLQNITNCVDQFRPDQDYLAIIGDHLQLMAMTALLATKFEKFKVLRFDRVEKQYYSVYLSGVHSLTS